MADLSADSASGWLSSSSPGPGTSGRGRCWSRASGGGNLLKQVKKPFRGGDVGGVEVFGGRGYLIDKQKVLNKGCVCMLVPGMLGIW